MNGLFFMGQRLHRLPAIFLLFSCIGLSVLFPAPVWGEAQMASGNPIALRDGELTITLPKGWKIYPNIEGQTLLAQAADADSFKFQRAIQILTFGGPKFLDEVTAGEFKEVIARKFSGASSSIRNYQMNNHLRIELADGRPAILYYAEFEIDNRKYMQAHLLISNLQRHFIISYTDGAEHFANDAHTQNLNQAWQAMISTTLVGTTPQRYRAFYQIGFFIGILLIAAVVFGVYRKVASRNYEKSVKLEFSEDLATQQNQRRQVSGPNASLYEDDSELEGSLDLDEESKLNRKDRHKDDDGMAG
jgi:hypothetical protein